jgi:serine/threonine protein kinase
MSAHQTFHCPQCGAASPAIDGEIHCHTCGHVFEPARVDTVAQPEKPSYTSHSSSADLGSVPELAPGVELGGYVLEKEIGRGGMGIVYTATQKSLQRKVALKVLPRKLATDPHFVERFTREALTLATLNHPSIVQIIDRGVTGEICYLVMEFVDGASLRHILGDQKLSPEKALQIVPQLCAALEYAHSRGVVHRDVKPENILLTRDGTVKITDFGLARIIHGDQLPTGKSLTNTNVVMGTPDYMAPEQREKAKAVDHRADIYSLGVIFYEMLTGELPIGRFANPSRKVQIDVRLDDIVLKSLEKEPGMRYQRASQLSDDVEAVSKNQNAANTAPSEVKRVQIKNGPQVEVGPHGVKVIQEKQASGVSMGTDGIQISSARGAVSLGRGGISITQDASADSGVKREPRLSAMAVFAFLLALIPLLIVLSMRQSP